MIFLSFVKINKSYSILIICIVNSRWESIYYFISIIVFHNMPLTITTDDFA